MAKEEDLEKFAEELQGQIMEQIRRRYSKVVIDHWQNPRNFRKIDNPDGYGKVTGPCGDTMEMFLKAKGGKIIECGFQTDGCGTTIVCGSVVTEAAKNMTFTQALALISADDIIDRLGGLPEPDVHCAQLAAETMRHALVDCLSKEKSQWKK